MYQHIIDYYNLVLQTARDARTRTIAFNVIMEYQQMRMHMLVSNFTVDMAKFQ